MIRNKKICPYCNSFISFSNFARHIESCQLKLFSQVQHVDHLGLNCKYCDKLCKNKNSLAQHECRCILNPKRIDLSRCGNKKGYMPVCKGWNKGLTSLDNPKLLNGGYKTRQLYKGKSGRKHTTLEKYKISQKLKGNHNNDINKTGRGIKGWYKGIFCSSRYELAFVIYCIDHDIDIKRCTNYYRYTYNNKEHRYYPDFIIDNIIYEIKGYWTELVDIKAQSVIGKEIKVLYPNDLAYVFKYIKDTYNKDVDINIQDLYESNIK